MVPYFTFPYGFVVQCILRQTTRSYLYAIYIETRFTLPSLLHVCPSRSCVKNGRPTVLLKTDEKRNTRQSSSRNRKLISCTGIFIDQHGEWFHNYSTEVRVKVLKVSKTIHRRYYTTRVWRNSNKNNRFQCYLWLLFFFMLDGVRFGRVMDCIQYILYPVLGYVHSLSVRFFGTSVRAHGAVEQTGHALLLDTRACSFSSSNSHHFFILTVLRQFCTYEFPDSPFIRLARR